MTKSYKPYTHVLLGSTSSKNSDIRSNDTVMSDALRRYIEANVPMIKHSAPIQPMWPGTKIL